MHPSLIKPEVYEGNGDDSPENTTDHDHIAMPSVQQGRPALGALPHPFGFAN